MVEFEWFVKFDGLQGENKEVRFKKRLSDFFK